MGVFVIRLRKMNLEGAYRTFGFPLTPIIYLGITLWTLVYILINRPQEGWAGIGIIAAGAVLYFASAWVEKRNLVVAQNSDIDSPTT